MKGIRKLFLGLILLTLFGVAFRVDAKAAPGISIGTIPAPSFGGTTPTLSVPLTIGSEAFVNGTPKTYNFNVYNGSTAVGTQQAVVCTYDGTTYKVNGTTVTPPATLDLSIPMVKSDIRTAVQATGSVELTVKDDDATATVKAIGINAGKVTVKTLTSDGEPIPPTLITGITPGNPYYILEGDSANFGITVDSGYEFSQWTINGVNWGHNNAASNPVEMDTARNIELTANYLFDSGKVVVDNLQDAKIAKNRQSNTKTVHYIAPYDSTRIKQITMNGEPWKSKCTIGANSLIVTAPNLTGNPSVTLGIVMDDGATYSYSFTVVDTTNMSFSTTNKTIYVSGNYVDITPVTFTGVEPLKVSYTPLSSTGIYTATQPDTGAVWSVKGLGSGEKTITAAPDYSNIEGYTPTATSKTFTLTVKEASPLEFTKSISVNKGLNVNLKDFLKYDSDTVTTTVTNSSGGLITISPSSGTNAISKYVITGSSKGTKEKGVSITGAATGKDTADVTVYTEPSITVETSSTSSSSSTSATYSYTVTMPKGVYHDETKYWVDDLKKAILIFKSSSDDGKTKEVVLDDLKEDSSDKLAKKQTKKIDVRTLTGYFRDICKKDEETVSVWACAVNGEGNNDDKVKTDTKDIKVYKISLDTNGGKTSYTVNGDTVYDYFYKIDGVEYTVVAKSSTGKGKVDKTNSVNADNATETTGTATIKLGSSGTGVLGEKRIKVAFSASSTPDDSAGGGGSDDYDDVPKTGESKADIWILWSVLFISILGAGFMIWKRFGLVRAIAEADEEVAAAEFEEKVNAAKKEKEDKMKMLKDLRNL